MPARGSPRSGGVLQPSMPAAEDLRQQVAGSFAEPAWPAAVRGRLDRILTQICRVGVVHADPHPGHVHVTADGDLVLPGLGPAGRREHARQLRLGPSHYVDRNTSRRAVVRWAARPACSLGGPQDRRPGTLGGPVPAQGFQLSAEYSVSPRHPPRAHRHVVTRPQSGHPTSTTSNEPQNGKEAGQGVCHATCSWRAE